MPTNFRIGDRVEDKETHKRGRVTFVYRELFFDPTGLGRAGERAAKRRCMVRIPRSVLLLHSDVSTFKRK
jgi:hypothetical protein